MLAVVWTLTATLIAVALLMAMVWNLFDGRTALAVLDMLGVVPWTFLALTSMNNWRNT